MRPRPRPRRAACPGHRRRGARPLAGDRAGRRQRHRTRGQPVAADALPRPRLLDLPDHGALLPGGRAVGRHELRPRPSRERHLRAMAGHAAGPAVPSGRRRARGLDDGSGRAARPRGGPRDRVRAGQAGVVAAVVPAGLRRLDSAHPIGGPAAPGVAARHGRPRRSDPVRHGRARLDRLGQPGGWVAGAVLPGRGLGPRPPAHPDDRLGVAARRRRRHDRTRAVGLAYPASMVESPAPRSRTSPRPRSRPSPSASPSAERRCCCSPPYGGCCRGPPSGRSWRWRTSPR